VVVVAAHRGDRSDARQLIEDARIADVAGVDQVIAAGQRRQRLRAQEAVGIGDQADFDCAGCGLGYLDFGLPRRAASSCVDRNEQVGAGDLEKAG
jgi:hypothetical protein